MPKYIVKDILNKKIISTEGTEIGLMSSVSFNTQTSDLVDLVVKPDMALDKSKYLEDGDYINIPFASVTSIKDYIIINESIAQIKK